MDTLMKLLSTVPGATRWRDGEREVDIRKVIEDDEFIYPLSDGEKALVWFFAQLHNGYTPDALRDEGWGFRRALFALDAENRQRWLTTMILLLGEMP